MLWPHLSQQGSVGGNGYCIWVCSPVLAGHVESATIVSTGASASREHCSGPLALWLMPQISSLGTFQTTIFSLGLRLGESTCKPSRREVLGFYGTLGPPDISHWHSKPDILGACFSGVDFRGWGAEVPDVGYQLLASLGAEIPSFCVTELGRVLFARLCLCLSYPSQCVPFILCCRQQFI